MQKRIWAITVTLIFLVILAAIYNFYENRPKKVSLYKQEDFNTVNNVDSWHQFREKLTITNNAKLENFKLTLDKNQTIYSVVFDVIDKEKDYFIVYHYRTCYSCEEEEDNKVSISKQKIKEKVQYDELMDAEQLFSKLDYLNQKNFFSNPKFEYQLIVSLGTSANLGLEGKYFLLKDKELQKIEPPNSNGYLSGFYLLVIGKQFPKEFGTDMETTKIVLFDEVKRGN
ncbi:MAG: hypothetical protein ABF649_19625 [Bacillus sp. (in: firmicutes)]